MANLLRTTDGKMLIKWVRRDSVDGEKLHFTLCGLSGAVIAKTPMSADYIRDYVLINSMPDAAKKARIARLCKELEDLLYSAPEEDECSYEEADLYSEMANLYNAIKNYMGD